jgi:hypothetical protein
MTMHARRQDQLLISVPLASPGPMAGCHRWAWILENMSEENRQATASRKAGIEYTCSCICKVPVLHVWLMVGEMDQTPTRTGGIHGSRCDPSVCSPTNRGVLVQQLS